MGRDTARVIVVTLLVSGFMALSVTGIAGSGEGTRLPFGTTPATSPSPADRGAETVVVAPGDHFWKISARRLAETDPEAPVGPYWRRVVEANRDNIRSGDPDLIYPGEVVELPAP